MLGLQGLSPSPLLPFWGELTMEAQSPFCCQEGAGPCCTGEAAFPPVSSLGLRSKAGRGEVGPRSPFGGSVWVGEGVCWPER